MTIVVESYIRQKFAEHADLADEQIFSDGVTLGTVIARSPKMTNSIDLMEAFARTANALRKDHGVRVRLPALPLDTSMSDVMKIFLEEFEREQKEAAA